MAPAVNALRDQAALAGELAAVYAQMLRVDAAGARALGDGDLDAYDRCVAEAAKLGAQRERVEAEMAVIRSLAYSAA